jgi:hypothetical protein
MPGAAGVAPPQVPAPTTLTTPSKQTTSSRSGYRRTATSPTDARPAYEPGGQFDIDRRTGNAPSTGGTATPARSVERDAGVAFENSNEAQAPAQEAPRGRAAAPPQDLAALGGKILRMTRDGDAPADNRLLSVGLAN